MYLICFLSMVLSMTFLLLSFTLQSTGYFHAFVVFSLIGFMSKAIIEVKGEDR